MFNILQQAVTAAALYANHVLHVTMQHIEMSCTLTSISYSSQHHVPFLSFPSCRMQAINYILSNGDALEQMTYALDLQTTQPTAQSAGKTADG